MLHPLVSLPFFDIAYSLRCPSHFLFQPSKLNHPLLSGAVRQAAVRLLEDEYPAESLLLDEAASTAMEQVQIFVLSAPFAPLFSSTNPSSA